MSMANRITIPIGAKFGRLTVIDNSELKHLCRCECGTIKAIDMYSLLKGDTMSCGCFHREMSRDMLTTHGLSKTRLHSIWAGMISRCHNENQNHIKIMVAEVFKFAKNGVKILRRSMIGRIR